MQLTIILDSEQPSGSNPAICDGGVSTYRERGAIPGRMAGLKQQRAGLDSPDLNKLYFLAGDDKTRHLKHVLHLHIIMLPKWGRRAASCPKFVAKLCSVYIALRPLMLSREEKNPLGNTRQEPRAPQHREGGWERRAARTSLLLSLSPFSCPHEGRLS